MKEEKRRNKLMTLIEVYGGQRSLAFELRALGEQHKIGVSPKTRKNQEKEKLIKNRIDKMERFVSKNTSRHH